MDALGGREVGIVGRGRLGNALSEALRSAGIPIEGPLGRGEVPRSPIVLLCVPDREIAGAAAALPHGRLVGHCSGALGLDVLASTEGGGAFAFHPLMTVTSRGADFRGATAAVAGSDPDARRIAESIAARLGMRTVVVPDDRRPLYHAAASVAANYLVTVEGVAERLAAGAGIERRDLLPLARAALDNWGELGARGALTGPVARGDDETVERQRAAVAEAAPDLLAVWDALTRATRELASGREAMSDNS